MKQFQEFDLKLFLEKYRNYAVDFYRFRGNYGDSLIYHGSMKLFIDLNIKVNKVDLTTEKINEILIIDGGGNFVDYYNDVRDFINAKHHLYKEIVFLPHTIFGDKQIEVLKKLKENTTIFCREKESAKFVEKYAVSCSVFLWHDCALYNSFQKNIEKGYGILNAFRSDCESILKTKPDTNIDISYNGYATKPLNDFLETIGKFNQINTDRLHVAIASVLLDKNVYLYPNSYFKNKKVYEYSLQRFSNIKFIELKFN